MGAFDTIDREIIRWSRVVSLAGLVGLLTMAVLTVGEGISRSVFRFPILGVGDVSAVVVTVTIASCFPLVFAERRSVTIRMFGGVMGLRGKAFLEAFGSLVTLGILVVIVWQLWIYAGELAEGKITTYQLRWPLSPWYRSAAIMVALCIPVQTFVFTDYMRRAFARREMLKQEEKVNPGHSDKEDS